MNWMSVTSDPLVVTLASSVAVVPDIAAALVVTSGVDATVNEEMTPELLPLTLLAVSR
jgi:hypothetical protein